MKKSTQLFTLLSALTLASATYAEQQMEKCAVVGPDGKGLIKEHKGDCSSSNGSSCAGNNEAGDPKAWIMVPKGMCNKINMAVNSGDFKGIPDEIKAKIEVLDDKGAVDKVNDTVKGAIDKAVDEVKGAKDKSTDKAKSAIKVKN